MSITETLERLKTLLGISGEGQDELLSLAVDEVNAYIMAYCRRDSVPPQVDRLVPAMAALLWRSRGYGGEAAPRTVKQVTQGNRTVVYESPSADPYSDLFAPFRIMLNPYRKARTPGEITEYEEGAAT